MWTELIFGGLFVLHCAVSSSPPKPVNVSFSSVNLRNVLHWSPGNDTPDGTHFSVEYVIYGDTTEVGKGKRVKENWRAVQQCTNIVRTWCDLSVETWAEEEGYYARVRAMGRKSSSKWAVTKNRFDPKWDTIFGPPLLSVETEDNSAIVTLKGPMRYSPNNDTPPLSMKAIYPQMLYNLSIYNTHRKLMHHFPLETSQYKYQLLDYNTEYCFFAKSRFISIPAQCKSSAWHCIVTPQDPVIEQLQKVVVGIVVPSLCICIIVVVSYLLYNYLAGKEQRMPFRLNQLSFHPNPLVLLPDNMKLQNIPTMPSVSSQQSNNLSDDYGVLTQPAAQKAEAGNVKVEMEKGAWCSNWDPETMPLMQPCMRMGFNNEERLDGTQPLEKGTEDKRAGNCDELYMTRSQLKLENVFLRQNSEMEAGPQVEEETGSEVDDPFSKWNLKLSELF